MSVLSYIELVQLVEDEVISPVSYDDINAASIDIHLGNEIVVESIPDNDHRIVDVHKREVFRCLKFDLNELGHYDLAPGEFILAHTREIFNLPLDICAEFKLKSSGARTGLENALATWCFTGETKVALLSGENVPIKDLVGQDDVWVYALDEEGRFVPAKASCVFQSGVVSETVVVTLDDEASFECTPEHLIMLRDGSYRKACELRPEDAVMPLYRKLEGEHERVYSNHKVLSVVRKTYADPIPVFDMTVPEYHNFALASGVFVHNCDNGWHGSTLTLELKNFLKFHSLRLKPGMKIGQMVFHRTVPVPLKRSYKHRGRYNNDKSVQTVKE